MGAGGSSIVEKKKNNKIPSESAFSQIMYIFIFPSPNNTYLFIMMERYDIGKKVEI